MSVAGCAASKPATDFTYQDVPSDKIADRIFLADVIAEVERCQPPFSDVRILRPDFVSPPPPVDGGCGGKARSDAGPEYVEAVARITALHDTVVNEWNVRLQSGTEAAETRAADITLVRCLDREGFAQRGPGDPSLESYGIGSGDVALNRAAQKCSDQSDYGYRIAYQRVRTLRSVLGRHEAEIIEIGKLRPLLARHVQPADGPDGARFGLPE